MEFNGSEHTVPSNVGDQRVDGYVALRSYAAIGDTRSIALVARDGSVDWYPIPELDSLPVFGRLLDASHGGMIELRPVDEYSVSRRYLPGTNVLQTTFTTSGGRARVTDALNIGTTGPLPWNELVRYVEGLDGDVEMTWSVTPGNGLGEGMPWSDGEHDLPILHLNSVTLGVLTEGTTPHVSSRAVDGRFTTSRGSTHLLAIVATAHEPLHVPDTSTFTDSLQHTVDYWTNWTQRMTYSGPWREEVLRSALVLRLLTNSESGAIAAAATTSLPENWDGKKNWDYRFAWVRDAAYTLHALLAIGESEEAHGAVSWLLRVLRKQGENIRAFTTLQGDHAPGERQLVAEGWRGIGPVVEGNRAGDQLQLSVFGDIFKLVRQYVDGGHLLDTGSKRMLATIADLTCDSWQLQDSGKWELLEERHYTSSKMGCWQALACAVALAEEGQLEGNVARWRLERNHIGKWIDEHCWSDTRNSYVWYAGSDGLDASVLLYAADGVVSPKRMSSTIDAIFNELGSGPLLHRFSGAADEEGAFVACSFWAVAALVNVGRQADAEDLMEALIPLANDLGLFTEMIDTETSEFMGNFPQGLSHLALMEAALHLAGYAGEGTT